MLIEKMKKKAGYTSADKSIAEEILAHPGDFEMMTADQLAIAAHVSKASVIRFAKKNGCDGYRSFQRQLIYELQNLAHAADDGKEKLSAVSRLRDVMDVVPSLYSDEIYRTRSLMELPVMERVIRMLENADEVEIYGSGITSVLAQEAAYKFRSVGIQAYALTGLNEHSVFAEAGKKRTALLLSFTGRNAGICTIGRYLRKHGYIIIGIGGQESDALKQIVQEYITVDSSSPALSLEVLSEMAGFRYVIDVIFTTLMIRDYDENINNALLLKGRSEPKDAENTVENEK